METLVVFIVSAMLHVASYAEISDLQDRVSFLEDSAVVVAEESKLNNVHFGAVVLENYSRND